jgi:cyclopropane-fatty-acyl-phospholipid synthase
VLSKADIQVGGDRPWDIQVNDSRFYSWVLKDKSLGLGESYMAGFWDCEALDEFFYHIITAKLENRFKPSWAWRWNYIKARVFNRQSKASSQAVIDQHYQLGNDLYEKMLDKTMAYSCGYWEKANTLDKAQIAKYDLIAKKLQLKAGMRLLDIGCGWGGFAKFVAENYKVSVVAITLSENQAEYARKVCAGLPVEIRVQDYRDLNEKFDRVVEIGMFEHVGVKNYRTFMEVVYNALNDDGMVMIHTIGSNISMLATDAWIDKYIFTGGQLPSIAQIGKSIEGLFIMEDWHNFGADYDKTLMAWFDNFRKNWPLLQKDYPPSFYRMWQYYLLSCAGAFRARDIQLWQIVLSKNGVIGGYESVR